MRQPFECWVVEVTAQQQLRRAHSVRRAPRGPTRRDATRRMMRHETTSIHFPELNLNWVVATVLGHPGPIPVVANCEHTS